MKRLILVPLIFIAAACGGNPVLPEKQSFLVQPDYPSERSGAIPRKAGVLRIGRVEVATPFDGRAWIYRRTDVRYEADYYNEFGSHPADMVSDALVGWLGTSGLFEQVVSSSASAEATYRLETEVASLYVDFQEPMPAAVVTLRWRMLRDGIGTPVLQLECRQRVTVAERSPAGAARAYREALRQAFVQLEERLAAVEL